MIWTRRFWLRLGILLLPLAGGFLVALSVPDMAAFYHSLRLPIFAPPVRFFPIAWSVLYLCLGIASLQILHAGAPRREKRNTLLLFYLQLAVNWSWVPVFFGFQNIGLGFWVLALLLFLAAFTLCRLWRLCRRAFWWMLPYGLFLCFALLLNFSILRLNG